MQDYQEVPYIRLSVAQKNKCLGIVRPGVNLLKKWSAFYSPKKYRDFRNRVLNGDKNPHNAIPKDKLAEFHADLPYILAIRHNRYADLGGKTVEEAILQNFAALAKRHARKWSLEGDPNGISRRDYLQEAYMTVVEAVYAYNREDVDFSTFVWVALKNRMINVTNQQGHLLSPLTNADLELMIRYERAKKSMNKHVTFHEIVDVLGLSHEEGSHLNGLLTRVFAENQLGGTRGDGNAEDDPSGNDYTGYRSGVDHESESELLVQQAHVNSVLDRAGLNELERKCIETAMDPYYGWQADLARKLRNPKNGQPYSRMWINMALNTAREKVAKVLKAEAA